MSGRRVRGQPQTLWIAILEGHPGGDIMGTGLTEQAARLFVVRGFRVMIQRAGGNLTDPSGSMDKRTLKEAAEVLDEYYGIRTQHIVTNGAYDLTMGRKLK